MRNRKSNRLHGRNRKDVLLSVEKAKLIREAFSNFEGIKKDFLKEQAVLYGTSSAAIDNVIYNKCWVN